MIEVRIVIQHAMETGYRHDDVGHLIKRNVINASAATTAPKCSAPISPLSGFAT